MNKEAAKQLVGKLLYCWTGLNGCYIGECLSIKSEPRLPWRAEVRILAIAEFPVQGLRAGGGNFIKRRPFEFGSVREFGNSSVKLFDGPERPNYRESILKALETAIRGTERAIEHARQRNLPYGIELRSLEALHDHLNKESENDV